METTFLPQLMEQLYPLLATAIVIIVGALVQKLKAWVQTKTDNETALLGMDHFQNIVDDVVMQVADDIKKESSAEDDTPGIITREEANMIKDKALSRLKGEVPPALSQVLEKVIGDLDKWLNGMIINSIRVNNIQYRSK